METNTEKNLYDAFTGEAKAVVRLKAFAKKAEEEGYLGIAKLFRAIAESEFIHAYNNLKLMNTIKDTETNLQESLGKEEKIAAVSYNKFITEAENEGKKSAAINFTFARDVEERHAK